MLCPLRRFSQVSPTLLRATRINGIDMASEADSTLAAARKRPVTIALLVVGGATLVGAIEVGREYQRAQSVIIAFDGRGAKWGRVMVRERREFPYLRHRSLMWEKKKDAWLLFSLGHDEPAGIAPDVVQVGDAFEVLYSGARVAVLDCIGVRMRREQAGGVLDEPFSIVFGADPMRPTRRLYHDTPGWSEAFDELRAP